MYKFNFNILLHTNAGNLERPLIMLTYHWQKNTNCQLVFWNKMVLANNLNEIIAHFFAFSFFWPTILMRGFEWMQIWTKMFFQSVGKEYYPVKHILMLCSLFLNTKYSETTGIMMHGVISLRHTKIFNHVEISIVESLVGQLVKYWP